MNLTHTSITRVSVPEGDRRYVLPVVMLFSAAVVAVIVFLPPEGRLTAPVHDGLAALLGRATFVVPVGLALAGVALLVRRRNPQTRLPVRRLIGIGALLLAVLPAEHALGQGRPGTGLVGEWLSVALLESVGGPGTLLLLLALIVLGVVLTFELRLPRVTSTSDAES